MMANYKITTWKQHSGWAYHVTRDDKIIREDHGFVTEHGAREAAQKWIDSRPTKTMLAYSYAYRTWGEVEMT